MHSHTRFTWNRKQSDLVASGTVRKHERERSKRPNKTHHRLPKTNKSITRIYKFFPK